MIPRNNSDLANDPEFGCTRVVNKKVVCRGTQQGKKGKSLTLGCLPVPGETMNRQREEQVQAKKKNDAKKSYVRRENTTKLQIRGSGDGAKNGNAAVEGDLGNSPDKYRHKV